MANDGEVRIEPKVETKNLENDLNKVKKSVKSSANEINAQQSKLSRNMNKIASDIKNGMQGTDSAFQNVKSSVGMVGAAIAAAIGILKKYFSGIKEVTEAFHAQYRAEVQLAAAAKNNPLINEESVARLKEYASAMQQVTEYGDETLIPLMAELVTSGRKEAEIMQIMQAAADMTAAGMGSLDQNVMQLNATFSGTTGTLGKYFSELKNLTEEELAAGRAIDIVRQKTDGYAQEVASTVGSLAQMKNAQGDLNEALGRVTKPAVDHWRSFWTNIFNWGTKTLDAIDKNMDVVFDKKWAKKQTKIFIDTMQGLNGDRALQESYARQVAESMEIEDIESLLNYLNSLEKKTDEHWVLIAKLQNRIDREAKQAANKRAAEARLQTTIELDKETEAEETHAAAIKTANDYARESNKELEKRLAQLELEAELTGKEVDASEKYNIILDSYIGLLTDCNGTIQKGYPIEVKRREQLEKAEKAMRAANNEEEKRAAILQATAAATQTLNDIREAAPAGLESELEKIRQIRAEIEAASAEEIMAAQNENKERYSQKELLEGLAEAEKQIVKDKVNEVAQLEQSEREKEKDSRLEMLGLIDAINANEVLSEKEKLEEIDRLHRAYNKSKAEMAAATMQEIQGYTLEAMDIANQATQLMTEYLTTSTDLEMAEIDRRYEKGLINEQEYYDAITEVKKKAAKEQYKIDMFEWSASLLAATANIAQGVSKAIATGGAAGLITGALVAAAGGAQIASIVASKPIPPAFAAGGIIGGANGASMGADNTYIHARTGEMVLNANQQRALWNMLSGPRSQGGAGNITVNNMLAGRGVATDIHQQDGGLYIDILDKHINKGLRDGSYDAGFAAMHTRQEGVRIL